VNLERESKTKMVWVASKTTFIFNERRTTYIDDSPK